MVGVQPFGSGSIASILGCVSSEFDDKQLWVSACSCEQKISNKSTQMFILEGSCGFSLTPPCLLCFAQILYSGVPSWFRGRLAYKKYIICFCFHFLDGAPTFLKLTSFLYSIVFYPWAYSWVLNLQLASRTYNIVKAPSTLHPTQI